MAGKQTAGKTYLATSSNIAKFTNGRFRVPDRQLAPVADAPNFEPEERRPLPSPQAVNNVPSTLLVTDDDCLPETLDLPPIETALLVPTSDRRSPLAVAQPVLDFEAGALADTAERLRAFGIPNVEIVERGTLDEKLREGGRQIVGATIPVGPGHDAVMGAVRASGQPYHPITRPWDARFWPHATAGFFKLKKAIPKVLADLAA